MKRFLILSAARSGSTSLREALNARPDTLCHGEIFALNKVIGTSRKLAKDPEMSTGERAFQFKKFCDSYFPEDSLPNQGAKFIFHQAFDPANLRYLDWFRAQKADVIFLWRRNLLKRYRSGILLRHDIGLMKEEQIARLTPQHVVADCKQQILMAQMLGKMHLRRGGMRPLLLDFEELIAPTFDMTKVSDFLELPPHQEPMGKDARSRLDKERPVEALLDELLSKPALQRFADISNPLAQRPETTP